MLQPTSRGSVLVSLPKNLSFKLFFFSFAVCALKRKTAYPNIYGRSKGHLWRCDGALTHLVCFSHPPPRQVFSLLIVAIGVYAKIQKATGKKTKTHHRVWPHPLPVCKVPHFTLWLGFVSPFSCTTQSSIHVQKVKENVNAKYTAVSHVSLPHWCLWWGRLGPLNSNCVSLCPLFLVLYLSISELEV